MLVASGAIPITCHDMLVASRAVPVAGDAVLDSRALPVSVDAVFVVSEAVAKFCETAHDSQLLYTYIYLFFLYFNFKKLSDDILFIV